MCECVVKYRWQIDRLKILQALLGIFCAKIPFFFLLYPVHFLHTWRNPVFAFYFCLLVKYICFCVGFVFFVYFSYGNNWHIYCIWLFIVSFITFFSFIVIRCEMSLVKFLDEMWWKMCDSSGARTVLSKTKPIYCSVLHARKRQNGLLRFEHGLWSFACVCVRVLVTRGWKQIKQSFSTGFLCFIFNV